MVATVAKVAAVTNKGLNLQRRKVNVLATPYIVEGARFQMKGK